MNVPEDERKRILAYYQEETSKLNINRRDEEAEARAAWKKRRQDGDVVIVESDVADMSIRDAVSFLVADAYEKPPVVLIYQPNRVVYVQDTPTAVALHKTFGGFTFGQNKCWGRAKDEHGTLPSIDEVLAAHRLALAVKSV